MDYNQAKKKIRAISKMNKTDKQCFISGSNKDLENHHVISVSRLADFVVSHSLSPRDIPIPTIPLTDREHKLIHQFQNECGGVCRPTEDDLAEMFLYKEQLKTQQRSIDHIFDNEWIDDYHDMAQEQIDDIEYNLDKFGFDIEQLQGYINEEVNSYGRYEETI